MLPAGSVFAFLAEHRHSLFPDDAFEDLFKSGRGRPSTPADVVASVMVLQTLHNLSDRETAEAVTFDLRWKAACGFALTETSCHPTVLTYWRKRLAGRIAYTADVAASNEIGIGAASASSAAFTIPVTIPGIPDAPTLTAPLATEPAVTWSAPADNSGSPITRYRVNLYRGSNLVNTATTDALTLAFSGPTRATAYTAEVSAENAIGSDSVSERSAVVSTKATVPDAGDAPWLVQASASEITVTWTAPNNGGAELTGYTVRLFNGSALVETKTASATTVTFANLARGIAYTADVAASNTIGSGAASARSEGVTIPATTPSVPAAPTVTSPSATEAVVAWSAPAGTGGSALAGYTVTVYHCNRAGDERRGQQLRISRFHGRAHTAHGPHRG